MTQENWRTEWGQFAVAVLRHSGYLVSGVLVTIAAYVWGQVRYYFQPDGPDLPWNVSILVGLVLIFIACFLAWRDEHRTRLGLEAKIENAPRPLIRATYLSNTPVPVLSIDDPHQRFSIDNIGGATAFNITFDEIVIGRFRVRPDRVDSLVPQTGNEQPTWKGTLDGKRLG